MFPITRARLRGSREEQQMSREYRIAPCSGIKIDVKQGQSITVIDVEGGQVVDFFAEAAGNEMEFLSTGATIDCNESLTGTGIPTAWTI